MGRNATIALRTGQQVRLGAPGGAAPTWPCAAASSSSQCSDRAPPTRSRDSGGAAGRRRRLAVGGARAGLAGYQEAPPRSAGAGTVVPTASPGRARAPRRRGCAVRGDLDGQRGQQPRRHPPRPGRQLPLEHLPDLPELRSEGIAHGSVQVPPSGQPVLFGPDHPRHRRVSRWWPC